MPYATGAVMAGGKSSRLGRDKALLTVNGVTLLERAVRTVGAVTREQLVVGPPERQAHAGTARVLPDEFPSIGPLGGIYTALRSASNDIVLVVACDMPFLCVNLLQHLISLAEGYDIVLPRPEGRGEQLHAVYRKSCEPLIRDQIVRGDYKIDRFFEQARVRDVDGAELREYDPGLQSFANVNTQEEWAAAQAVLNQTL